MDMGMKTSIRQADNDTELVTSAAQSSDKVKARLTIKSLTTFTQKFIFQVAKYSSTTTIQLHTLMSFKALKIDLSVFNNFLQ